MYGRDEIKAYLSGIDCMNLACLLATENRAVRFVHDSRSRTISPAKNELEDAEIVLATNGVRGYRGSQNTIACVFF